MPFEPSFMNTGIIASRLAPAENTSSGDQMTRPSYLLSAISTAFSSPSITAGEIRCSFAVMLAISTSPSSDQTRISSLRYSSSPDRSGSGAPLPATDSGNSCRR